VNKTNITKGIIALVCIALIFATGLYFGRTGGPGGFTVTTQYGVGAMDIEELEALAERVDARAEGTAPQQTPVEPETVTQQPEVPDPGGGLININTATSEGLQALPGVGPAIADRIVAHREAHGPFRIIEEITDVSGIGPARFADIRDMITVE